MKAYPIILKLVLSYLGPRSAVRFNKVAHIRLFFCYMHLVIIM